MSTIADLRAVLAADLAGLGVPVAASWPDALAPPCAFITPPLNDQWVSRGPTFREHTIALDLVILVDHASSAPALAELEDLVEAALLMTADWALAGVEAPAPTSAVEGGAEYLASVIHLSKAVAF